jgi:thiamine-phosphate pyrophosphorylase
LSANGVGKGRIVYDIVEPKFRPRGYYAILDVKKAELGDLAKLVSRAAVLLAAGPCCLQLRTKTNDLTVMRAAARSVQACCRSAGVPFCVNDRLEVAMAVEADVVHLGQDDLPLAGALEVRSLIKGKRPFIGYSTHTLAQAVAAATGGADYIGFGPCFPTVSKENPDPVVGLDALAAVCAAVTVPVVAIGGIELDSVAAVARAGAAAAAVISAVDRAADPTAAGRLIAAAFAR